MSILATSSQVKHIFRFSQIFRNLTAFLRISVVADQDFLAWGPEERRPVDGVVEAQAAVVEDVDVPGADLVKRLELKRGDPALLQDQQRNAASTAGDRQRNGL